MGLGRVIGAKLLRMAPNRRREREDFRQFFGEPQEFMPPRRDRGGRDEDVRAYREPDELDLMPFTEPDDEGVRFF